ncbi:MAG TPA: glycosyltransferase family 4 protein [Gemmatimonadaceae bacterium]|jgi:glycosyltransferase involved in cell wall biosynthesis|nr:glycosyltransferase family 4 protein [Gemmatimonadaceae bacterium]
MAHVGAAPLRVAQVSFHVDDQRRSAESLLLAWPALSAVARCAARAGVATTVVQTAHRDETVERNGVSFHFVADGGRQRRRVVDRVASLGPDVVHVHGFHHGAAIQRLARALRPTPVIVQDHVNAPPRGWRRPLWRFALRSIAGAAFTLREQADPWLDGGLLSPSVPLFEILEGSSEFAPGDRETARRLTGISGDPCLLWTSRLIPSKDPLTMLGAVEEAMEHLPDARLWCCFGDATMLAAVRARIQRSDTLRSRVTLLGARPRDQMELLFRAADLYVQSSRSEGSGFSLIEAMSCGTVPVTADIPPARRIAGDAGALTPVGDAHAMARAIVTLARGDREALRRGARARFESALAFDVIGRQLRDAYETLAR